MIKEYLYNKNSRNGTGVFCSINISINSPICELPSNLVDQDGYDPGLITEVGPKMYSGPTGDIIDYFNHSCNPNLRLNVVGKRAIFYSVKEIRAGTELVWDYSTTSTDTKDEWSMNCNCGSFNCRKIITGWESLPEDVKNFYKLKGMFPLFISHPIFNRG